MFERNDKRGFAYWFAHWCAYNMTAINCNAWKLKYLFHDIEKPWLELIMLHDKVKRFHQRHNRHHFTYRKRSRVDWEALVIDWECSRFTKAFRSETAREVAKLRLLDGRINLDEYGIVMKIIERYGL